MVARAKKVRDKVVLAYSGGLDTSVAIRWLQQNYDLDVIAVSINVGQPGDLQEAVDRAFKIGAVQAYAIDATEEFVNDYIGPSLKANALYMGTYPLATSIARPLIAKIMVDIAKKEGAKYIAHGCTAKGNDQVRFDVSIAALAPEIKIIAPMREWVMTREEEIEYARKNDIPIKVKKECPYSTDENLWGRSCECGVLEDAMTEPPRGRLRVDRGPFGSPGQAELRGDRLQEGIAGRTEQVQEDGHDRDHQEAERARRKARRRPHRPDRGPPGGHQVPRDLRVPGGHDADRRAQGPGEDGPDQGRLQLQARRWSSATPSCATTDCGSPR